MQTDFKIQDVYERSPLAHDLAVHLELFLIVALHHQHDTLAYHEVCILVLIGVVAHAGHAVREVAENAAAIFAAGAKEFLDKLRSETQAIILSDTFEEFAQPLMKKLGWPTIFCNSLEVDADGFISGIKMRCEHSKLTTVRGLQSIGFETIASGDSYNDLEMIEASKAGFLFRTTEKIKHDYPHLPAFEGYDELLAAIEQVIRA